MEPMDIFKQRLIEAGVDHTEDNGTIRDDGLYERFGSDMSPHIGFTAKGAGKDFTLTVRWQGTRKYTRFTMADGVKRIIKFFGMPELRMVVACWSATEEESVLVPCRVAARYSTTNVEHAKLAIQHAASQGGQNPMVVFSEEDHVAKRLFRMFDWKTVARIKE